MRFMRLLLIFVAIFSLQVISYPPGVRISFHDSYDRSQPDPADEGALRCLDVGYKKDVECYDAKFVSMSFHRAVIDFTEKERSHYEQWLPVMLQDISSNATVNEMEVMFSGIGNRVTDAEDVFFDWLGNALDVFLTPHPSWSVQQEPYLWQKTWQISDSTFNHSSRSSSSSSSNRYSSGSVAGDGSLHSHTDSPLKVVLRRYRYDFEPYFQLLTDLQFPATQEKCANRTLVLGTSDCKFTGWGGVLDMHNNAKSSTPYAVHAMYSTRSNDVNESTAFIQGSDCPNERNKWLCAFLPMTNCTLPQLITDCREKNCVHSLRHTVGLSVMFDKAAVDGQEIDGTKKEIQSLAKVPHSLYQASLAQVIQKQVHFNYITPRNVSKAKWSDRFSTSATSHLLSHYFMLRQNAFYRQRVAEMIAHFREEMNFPSSKRCVAVHIRRGDRMRGENLNITEMCRKYHRHAGDMGCYGVPFAAITLQHVIEAATYLIEEDDREVKNLLVATDDVPWLMEQQMEVASISPAWNVYYMKLPDMQSSRKEDIGGHLSKKYWAMRWGGTESGVFLQSQIKVLQQCEGFVGHFKSSMSRLMYSAMCTKHGGYDGMCPPSFDMSEMEELKTHLRPQDLIPIL